MSIDPLLGEPEPTRNTGQQRNPNAGESLQPLRVNYHRSSWLFLGVVLAGSAAAIWWLVRSPEPTVEPPIPSGIEEIEVINALQRKQAEVQANPKSADAWGEYGMLLIAQLFDREAEFCFARASQLNPNDPRWSYTRGHIALKKDPPNAQLYLSQAIATTGPGDEYRHIAKLLLAEWLSEIGELDRAAELYNQELGPPPGQPRAVYGLAMIASRRGDEKTATQLWSSLLSNEYAKKQANVHLAA